MLLIVGNPVCVRYPRRSAPSLRRGGAPGRRWGGVGAWGRRPGMEAAAGHPAAHGEPPIAVAEIVKLRAKRHGLPRIAGADEGVVKLAVFAVPRVAEFRAVAFRTVFQPVRGGKDLRFPIPVAGGDG